MKAYTSDSLEETRKIATDWLNSILKLDHEADEAVVVGLSGHLGAGKTAFIKQIAGILGVKEEVTSPTFVLMKIYSTNHPRFHRLIHIDAYRLEQRQELEVLDYENLVADPHNLIMIEWPENVELNEFERDCNLHLDIKEGKYTIRIK